MIELIMKWLKYIKYHPEKFVDIKIVINVTYMKLTVYVLCEIVNLMYLAQSGNSIFIILCYMTFTVISGIDAMYYGTMKSNLKS